MKWIAATLLILVTALFFTLPPGDANHPGETVKILVSSGHGSGVHIGDGYIVTAAHVVTTETSVKIKLDDSTEQPGEVLWVNKTYDVALIRTNATMRAAPLRCGIPYPGEILNAVGNPLAIEFIRTEGRVAGVAREMGPWKLVVPVDITIIMGMSGGPAFDTGGNVVGVNVGVAIAQLGFSPSLTGIGFIVPGKVICELLARS